MKNFRFSHRQALSHLFTAHNKRGQRRERRQGAAAGCALYALRGRAGGKVPLPGAHANAPAGGVRAASTGKALVGLHNHLRGAQVRLRRLLRGRQGAAAGCARQCPFGGRAATGTGKHWLVGKAIYAAHNKRGQRRERM